LTIRHFAFDLTAFLVLSICAVIVSSVSYHRATLDLNLAQEQKYRSYILASELRQSSDDLTRLARTYVVTGEPKYEAQYWDVLAIRNGEKARPADYHRIYWDFVAATGEAPRPGTVKAPLMALMREAGFTEEEFAKLAQAQANSDGLVDLETEAMNAVKGLFLAPDGTYSVVGEPNLTYAAGLLHSDQYHRYKAEIMAPLDEFFVLMEERTSGAVVDGEERANVAVQFLAAAIVMMFLSVILTIWVFYTRVSQPLLVLTGVMKGLAEDRLTIDVPGTHRKDEIGDMARRVVVFRDGMLEAQRLREEQDANHRVETERSRRLEAGVAEFEQTIGEVIAALAEASTEMQASAEGLTGNADQATKQSAVVAAATQQATGNVGAVAGAAEELRNSISEIARQVQASTAITGRAVEEASKTNATVQGLADAAQKVGDVVLLIQDIAEQTNLLALNATIEAARAGDAGKGFAVVASEVKGLADQTRKATDDIHGQISSIQSATDEAVTAIRGIGKTIQEVSEIATAIASAVEQQSSATGEIARNAQEAAAGAEEVLANIAGVSEASEETGSAAARVLNAASVLSQQAAALRTEVEGFLSTVRAS